jgi:hypothetical protein
MRHQGLLGHYNAAIMRMTISTFVYCKVLIHCFISHESRAVALEKYSLQLRSSTSLANSRVDPKEDLVCFPWIKGFTSWHRNMRLFHEYIWSEEALKLEKIAIDSRAWHTWTIAEVLRTFKCLKELVLIVHSFSCGHTLEGNQATDLALKSYPFVADYRSKLDDWWLIHGGIEGGKMGKTKACGYAIRLRRGRILPACMSVFILVVTSPMQNA